MKTYYVVADNYPHGIPCPMSEEKPLIGAGATAESDLKVADNIYLATTFNPKVYKHLYNEENNEFEFVWAPRDGRYDLWYKDGSIYFKED